VCDARNHAHPLPRPGRRSGNTPISQLLIGSQNKPRVQVDERQVKEQTLERLQAVQPLLSEIMDVKLVVQPRKNMLNIRVKPEYVVPHLTTILVLCIKRLSCEGTSPSCGTPRLTAFDTAFS
jgi:hypothetical protein